jgi:glycine oxidase
LSAGAWSSQIEVSVEGEPHKLPRAFPIRGHLLGWRLPHDTLGPILRHQHTYILQRGSGFTIAGATEEHAGFDRSVDPLASQRVVEGARRLLPQLLRSEPDETWIGFRPAVEGGLPALGRTGGSALWLAYGHYRNGILMAPATARRIAAEITSS